MANEKNVEKKISPYEKLLPQYRIEGFDPNKVLTKVSDVLPDGSVREALFMRLVPSLAWFLTVFPDGCLNHTFVTLSDTKATVTASIYRHQSDVRPAVTATCTRYYSDSDDGQYYEQNAVTAAYRKGLEYLRFGTPPDAHEVEGIDSMNGSNNIPEKSDAGVIIPHPISPVDLNTELNAKDGELSEPAPTTKRQAEVKTPSPAPVPAQIPTPSSVAQAVEPMSYEEAKDFLLPTGAMKGKTIEEAAKTRGKSYIQWYANKEFAKDPNAPLTVALNLWCEYNP